MAPLRPGYRFSHSAGVDKCPIRAPRHRTKRGKTSRDARCGSRPLSKIILISVQTRSHAENPTVFIAPLTRVRQPLQKMGGIAASALLARITQNGTKSPNVIYVNPEL